MMNQLKEFFYKKILLGLCISMCVGILGTLFCVNNTMKSVYANEMDEFNIKDVSLTLSENIILNYTVEVPENYKNPYMIVSFNGKDTRIEGEQKTDGIYQFSFNGVTPQYLHTKVSAKAYANEGAVYSSIKEYSIKEYCETMLGKTDEELKNDYDYSPEQITSMHTLIVDLLNYGSASQDYKKNDVADLANKDLTQDQLFYAGTFETLDESYMLKSQQGTASEQVNWYSAGLHFDYNVSVYYTFELSNQVDISTVAVKVNKGTNEYTINNFTKSNVGNSKTKYIAYFNEVSLLDFEKQLTAQVYINNIATGKSLNYSVASYVYNKQNQTEENSEELTSMAKLAKAVYMYGKAAEEFVNAPELDKGEKVAFRMEGENGEFDIANKDTVLNDNDHLGFDLKFSNNLSSRSVNKIGDVARYTFNSDKAVSGVKTSIMISGYPKTNINVSNNFKIEINDTVVDTTGLTILPSECIQLGNNEYMIYKLLDLQISLKAGENNFKITYLKGEGGNIDYIELLTSAAITGFDTNHYIEDTNAVWKIKDEPTLEKAGVLNVSTIVAGVKKETNYTLPILSKENGYDLIQENERIIYQFKVKNQVFSIDPFKTYKITLSNKYNITFINGEKTADLLKGENFPEIQNNTGDARKILGWYNENKLSQNWSVDNFKMTNEDIVVAPYYSSGNQDLLAGSYKLADYTTVSSAKIVSNSIIDERLGTIVNYKGSNNQYFRFLTSCGAENTTLGIVAGSTYTFNFTFKNYGQETLKFKAIEVQGGIRYNDGTQKSSDLITLQAGESIDISLTITLESKNNNAMTVILLQNDVENAQLGILMSKINN